MFLLRSAQAVLWKDPLSIVLRVRPRLHVAHRATPEEFRVDPTSTATAFDLAIIDAFDVAALVEARAREAISDRLWSVRSFAAEHADRPALTRAWFEGVWILGRKLVIVAADSGEVSEVSFAEVLANGVPSTLPPLSPAVVEEVRASVRALDALPCFCHTGITAIEQHDALTILYAKSDPRPPIERFAAVARCTVCEQHWTFAWSAQNEADNYVCREFDARLTLASDEIDVVVAGIRDGREVVLGGSRCHTTIRARDGEFFAEDFDEGAIDEKPYAESQLRASIAGDIESYVDLLRGPRRAHLAAVLQNGEPVASALAAVGELLWLGESVHDVEFVVAVLAWPVDQCVPEMKSSFGDELDGLAVYHMVRSLIGYDASSVSAGRFGVHFFAVVIEMLMIGKARMHELRRYRAKYRAMAGDIAGAVEDLEWEKAHLPPDHPDVPGLVDAIQKFKPASSG